MSTSLAVALRLQLGDGGAGDDDGAAGGGGVVRDRHLCTCLQNKGWREREREMPAAILAQA